MVALTGDREKALRLFQTMHARIEELVPDWETGIVWILEQEPALWRAIVKAEEEASVAACKFFRKLLAWETVVKKVGAAEVAWRTAANHLNGLAEAGLL